MCAGETEEILIIIIIIMWLVLEWTLSFPQATSMPVDGMDNAVEDLLMKNSSPVACHFARQTRERWMAENRKESLLWCPNTPSKVDLVAADTRHVMALSWASEDFSWQQPAPPCCRILVLVEPSLLVRDYLFVMERPAYFVANLYRGRSTIRRLWAAGGSSDSSAPPRDTRCKKRVSAVAHVLHDSLGLLHSHSLSQMAARSVQPFLHSRCRILSLRYIAPHHSPNSPPQIKADRPLTRDTMNAP